MTLYFWGFAPWHMSYPIKPPGFQMTSPACDLRQSRVRRCGPCQLMAGVLSVRPLPRPAACLSACPPCMQPWLSTLNKGLCT